MTTPVFRGQSMRDFMRECLGHASVSDDYTASFNVGIVLGASMVGQASGYFTVSEAQGWRSDAMHVMGLVVSRRAAGGAAFESQAPVQPVEKGADSGSL